MPSPVFQLQMVNEVPCPTDFESTDVSQPCSGEQGVEVEGNTCRPS